MSSLEISRQRHSVFGLSDDVCPCDDTLKVYEEDLQYTCRNYAKFTT